MSLPGALLPRISTCRDMIEQVLLELPGLPPRVDRAPLVSLLTRALAVLARLAEGSLADPEHLDQVAAVTSAILGCVTVLHLAVTPDEARPLEQRLRAVERALEIYRGDALDELVASVPAPGPPRAEFKLRASVGVPALHRLDRRPLAPRPHVDAPDRSAVATDDDRAPARRIPDPEPAAVLLIEQLRRLAHDCFSELGALGNLRAPSADVPWSPALGRFEQRLLADLDAVVALGGPVIFDGSPTLRLDVLAELLAYADDALAPDPGRAFARAFVLGCVEGEDCVRAAVVALRQSDPWTHEAQQSALALASNPAITPAMETLALGDDAALSALALAVLRARREASIAVTAPLLAHPDPAVRRSAALTLGASKQRAPALALLHATLDADADDTVASAAAESLARLGSKLGLAHARRRLADRALDPTARADLLRIIATTGGPADGAVLAQHFEEAPTSAAIIEALAFHGHPGSVEPLLHALEITASQPGAIELRAALALALHQLTGARVEPTTEGAATFCAWWLEARAELGTDDERRLDGSRSPRRCRLGRPFTLAQTLDALTTAGPASARELLALELAASSSGAVRIDLHDWTTRQLAEIAAAHATLAGALRPGAWPESRLG